MKLFISKSTTLISSYKLLHNLFLLCPALSVCEAAVKGHPVFILQSVFIYHNNQAISCNIPLTYQIIFQTNKFMSDIIYVFSLGLQTIVSVVVSTEAK